jgi:O-antigen/teichoic acid export membrane protein
MNNSFSEEDVKKVAKGAGTTLIGSSIGKGLFFLSQIIIARFLGVEAFGLYALGFAVIKIAEIVSRLGLNMGGMRFVSIYKDNDPSKLKGVLLSATSISLLNGMLIGIILYSSSYFIAQVIFKKPELTNTLQLFAFSLPFIAGMTVVSYLLQGFHTTKYTVYTREFAQPLTNITLILSFYYFGFGLSGVIYAFILSHLVALIIGFVYLGKLFPGFQNRGIKPAYEIKNLISYSTPLLFVGFLHYFLSWTDTLMLGFLGSTKDVGIYRAASQVPFVMTLILAAANSIYAPLVADLYQKREMQRLSNIFISTTRWVTYITVPISIFLVFSSKEIMMLFGNGYIEKGHIVLIILSFGQLVNCNDGKTES